MQLKLLSNRALKPFFRLICLLTALSIANVASAQIATPTPSPEVTPTPTIAAPPSPEPTATPIVVPTATPLPQLFALRLSSSILREGGAPITATIVSPRIYERDVIFVVETLQLSGFPYPIRVVGPVILRAGQTQVSFAISAPDDAVFYIGRDTTQLRLRASGGVVGAANVASFTFVENDVPTLRVQLDNDTLREGNVEGGRIAASVSANVFSFPDAIPLQVTSSDPQSVYGASGFLLNSSSGFVTIIGRDNNRDDGPRRVRITINARGFVSANADITVLPLSAPFLRLRVQPPVVTEGESAQVTVSREGDLSRAVQVRIEEGFRVPATPLRTVNFAAGVANAIFILPFARDGKSQTTLIRALNARASGYASTRVVIYGRNIEPDIELRTDVVRLREGLPETANLSVRLSQPFVRDLPIRLRRFGSRLRFVQTPSSTLVVTIPAGETRIQVPFAAIDNQIHDRDRNGFTSEEGFAALLPFGFSRNQEVSVALNVVDDEAPLTLSLATNQTTPLPTGQQPDVRADLMLASVAVQDRTFDILAQGASGSSSAFRVTIAAGTRSVAFDVLSGVGTQNGTVRVTATEVGGNLRAAASLSGLPVFDAGSVVAENGPSSDIVLQRIGSTLQQTFALNTRFNRLRIPRQVTFRVGESRVIIRVQPINDQVRNIVPVEEITVRNVTEVSAQSIKQVTVVDDDTDLPSANETPSDARVVQARILSSSRSSVTVRLEFSRPIAASYFNFDFLVNGRPKPFHPNDDGNSLQSIIVLQLFSDELFPPGSRLTIIPNIARDADGRPLPATPITLIVPSSTGT